jgi:SAM-dependent methyltransferase
MSARLLRPSGIPLGGRVWPAREGYDLAAASYDNWYWQAFWRANEFPLVSVEITPRTGARALDVGSGTGLYLKLLRERGYQAMGIDSSLEMLRVSWQRLGSRKGLVAGDLQRLPLVTASLDLVIAARVLSHVADLEQALRELARVTRSGGCLVVTDVSATHRYVTTRIPTPAGDVHVETHKHGANDFTVLAQATGLWELESLREVRFRELIAPPDPADYPSVDASSERAIFFKGRLRRR